MALFDTVRTKLVLQFPLCECCWLSFSGDWGALPPDPPNLLVAAASSWPLMAAGWLILAANVRQQQAEDSGGWGR